jgi:Pro-kumamolisin, activation domain
MNRIVSLISSLAIVLFGSVAIAQEMVPIRRHTPDRETLQNTLVGATAMQASRSLELQITLKVQHKEAFDKLPDEQNDPNSPYYHHQFSREEIARDFGPSASDYQAVESWLTSRGFQIISVDDSFLSRSISFTGTAAQVQSVFKVQLMQSSDGESFSNTTDPWIPLESRGLTTERCLSPVELMASATSIAQKSTIRQPEHSPQPRA